MTESWKGPLSSCSFTPSAIARDTFHEIRKDREEIIWKILLKRVFAHWISVYVIWSLLESTTPSVSVQNHTIAWRTGGEQVYSWKNLRLSLQICYFFYSIWGTLRQSGPWDRVLGGCWDWFSSSPERVKADDVLIVQISCLTPRIVPMRPDHFLPWACRWIFLLIGLKPVSDFPHSQRNKNLGCFNSI